ncbi:hypothetical protein B0T21DRAFT_394691 [Apiosordaria backusii]|uniref:Uncharacterized protein n=1 Tax=Apiosordaria backusii TaxID=314023 RepID=A0AA40B888_9PEZI|nr:hypothetical protein B0T21DRAFT_394691 [Apiosordaria backusii]
MRGRGGGAAMRVLDLTGAVGLICERSACVMTCMSDTQTLEECNVKAAEAGDRLICGRFKRSSIVVLVDRIMVVTVPPDVAVHRRGSPMSAGMEGLISSATTGGYGVQGPRFEGILVNAV